jgi:hypothetical protein
VSLVIGAGLVVGPGAAPAAAERLTTPDLLSFQFDGQNGYVTFRDNTEDEEWYYVELTEMEDDFATRLYAKHDPVIGSGHVVSWSFTNDGMKPDVAYCAAVYATPHRGSPGGLLDDNASDNSNKICHRPSAPKPDLVIENIRGREESQVTPGVAYLVLFRNEGADANGTVVVDIATSGVAKIAADQNIVRPGWASMGFTCGFRTASGGANSLYRCRGGSLKQGQSVDPAIIVALTRPGFGAIHVSLSVSGSTAEADLSDNGLALNIQVR